MRRKSALPSACGRLAYSYTDTPPGNAKSRSRTNLKALGSNLVMYPPSRWPRRHLIDTGAVVSAYRRSNAMAPRSDPFARVRAAAAHLPEVEEATAYGTPSLKVRGKSFVRLKDADTLVVLCAIEEKEML